MNAEELAELIYKISRLRGFRAALVATPSGVALAHVSEAELDQTRMTQALEAISDESREACEHMGIGEFLRADVDLPEGHICVAELGTGRLIALFGAAAKRSLPALIGDVLEGIRKDLASDG